MTLPPHAKAIYGGQENNAEGEAIQQARCDPQPIRTPTSGGSPDRAVPKALGKEKCGQERQTDDDPQQ
jgi:hypothetical protein